jgi:D-amino-acid dehydrogenase
MRPLSRIIGSLCAVRSLVAARCDDKSECSPPKHSVGKKKVCVLGCGIAGLTTAMYLANDGYEVVCIESRNMEGRESSYLNGSLVCPSLTTPWANITTLKYILTSFLKLPDENDPLQTTVVDWKSIMFDSSFWGWLLRFVKSSVVKQDVQNGYNASYQLSLYSKECMTRLYKDKNINYQPGIAQGSLQVYGDSAKRSASLLAASTVVTDMHSLELAELRTIEPAISASVGSGGAILNGVDTSGDIGGYCKALRESAEGLGVTFYMNSTVTVESLAAMNLTHQTNIEYVNVVSTTAQKSVSGSHDGGMCWREYADFFVVATGNAANDISQWAGDGIVLWPMKGYALEVPISSAYANQHGGSILRHLIADDVEKIYIAPLDEKRVRISGIVDIGDRRSYSCRSLPINTSHRQEAQMDGKDASDLKRGLALLDKARTLLPTGYLVASNSPDVKVRVCYRPQTADDLPVIGQSAHFSNLYYNCGHGHLGFTRATGSSRLLVDMINRDGARRSSGNNIDALNIPQMPEAAHLPPVDCAVFSPKRLSSIFGK